jgi:hypothetical protein
MKKLVLFVFFINVIIYSQEMDNEIVIPNNIDEEYFYNYRTGEGITIYGKGPEEYTLETPEGFIVSKLNGYKSEREEFIETDFLEKAGFRRAGDIRYKKSKMSEKVLSVLHGVGHGLGSGFTFGLVQIPMKPFFEIELDELPEGEYYKFEQIILTSDYRNVSPEVLIVLKLEYKLQIEFCNGILIEKDNLKYYTEDNINYFEKMITELPEFPNGIKKIKDRFLNIELPRIKSALDRYKNPTEDYLRAKENLKEIYNFRK